MKIVTKETLGLLRKNKLIASGYLMGKTNEYHLYLYIYYHKILLY